MAKVTISALVEAGAHFGHQTRRWNPKMKPYIFDSRGDVHIIDLRKTIIALDEAYTFVSQLAANGGTVLFVGTKRQAQEVIADAADRCGMPYVNSRWLGGMLTNFATIRERVEYMERLENREAEGFIDTLPKKEQINMRKKLAKLQLNLNGIRNLRRLPDAVFIIDTNREAIPVREANKLGIPVVGTIDTNCDPDGIDYGIPANDDAIRSVSLLANFIADAVIAGSGAQVDVFEMEEVEQDESAPDGEQVEDVVLIETEVPLDVAEIDAASPLNDAEIDEETPLDDDSTEVDIEGPVDEVVDINDIDDADVAADLEEIYGDIDE